MKAPRIGIKCKIWANTFLAISKKSLVIIWSTSESSLLKVFTLTVSRPVIGQLFKIMSSHWLKQQPDHPYFPWKRQYRKLNCKSWQIETNSFSKSAHYRSLSGSWNAFKFWSKFYYYGYDILYYNTGHKNATI